MTAISSVLDRAALTLTFVAEYAADADAVDGVDGGEGADAVDAERVWRVWTDPAQLARWWAPPGWSTVVEPHEVLVGGRSEWRVTGPEGEEGLGWWATTVVDPPYRLEFDETFAGEDLEPIEYLDPTHTAVTIEPLGTGTRMTVTVTFPDRGQLDQMLGTGMEEGLRTCLEQIDAVLADPAR
ncbi:SRPBCC family protein [Plantactinospora endophytica]|uniref:Activator of HSP90 ATPase n=1 Tax=Plantactinospora endophytica TaxID=673535 RepID=A0ABQ4EAP8_9ACTN|nr:SRPBCC domain-containing protein [Plantactinospora endophytica]GIG91729.1 activator of HSP90 ATPase [Plantactinospora endophytica]